MASSNSLQQLRDLDRSSSEFHIKLTNVLLGKDCTNQVQDLSRVNPGRLAEDLDHVCVQIAFIRFLLNGNAGSHRSQPHQSCF